MPDFSFFSNLQKTDLEFEDSFSTLVNYLHFLYPQEPPKTLVITSAKPMEGKTTVAVNLAIFLAREGKKVLLIDGDLRQPRLHSMFHLENHTGLAEMMKENIPPSDLIYTVDLPSQSEESCGTLHVIPSGSSSNSLSRLFKAEAFKNSVNTLKETFDMVIIDSPPILAVDDGLLLAQLVDGVIMVLNTGVVKEGEAKKAKSRLESSSGKILGVILNRFNEKVHGAGLHSYNSYYAGPLK